MGRNANERFCALLSATEPMRAICDDGEARAIRRPSEAIPKLASLVPLLSLLHRRADAQRCDAMIDAGSTAHAAAIASATAAHSVAASLCDALPAVAHSLLLRCAHMERVKVARC